MTIKTTLTPVTYIAILMSDDVDEAGFYT